MKISLNSYTAKITYCDIDREFKIRVYGHNGYSAESSADTKVEAISTARDMMLNAVDYSRENKEWTQYD